MILSTELIVLILLTFLVTSIGWKKFVYFISLGYGFSVASIGIACIIISIIQTTIGTVVPVFCYILCLLLVIYGCRLGGFLLFREIKNASYKKEMPNLTKTSKPMTAGAKIAIWISVVLLYICQISPVFFRIMNIKNGLNPDKGYIFAIIGACVMIAAIVLESTADYQKSTAKKANPKRFCDKGLYKIVRCPNYFAEILFWTGVFISGIGSLQSAAQWIIASLGYLGIVYIMFGGARRLEIRQTKNYGSDSEYQAYVKKTPILIPLVPLYHLENATFFKG